MGISEADGHYIAGLVDGEGYFTISLKLDSRTKRGGLIIGTSFGIALRADDDAILRWIHATLGCGHIRVAQGLNGRCPMVRYSVTDRESAHRIVVPLFERFPLRSKKTKDFALWKKAVALAYTVLGERRRWAAGTWVPKWTPDRLAQMRELQCALRTGRRLEEAAR